MDDAVAVFAAALEARLGRRARAVAHSQAAGASGDTARVWDEIAARLGESSVQQMSNADGHAGGSEGQSDPGSNDTAETR